MSILNKNWIFITVTNIEVHPGKDSFVYLKFFKIKVK